MLLTKLKNFKELTSQDGNDYVRMTFVLEDDERQNAWIIKSNANASGELIDMLLEMQDKNFAKKVDIDLNNAEIAERKTGTFKGINFDYYAVKYKALEANGFPKQSFPSVKEKLEKAKAKYSK